MNSVSTALKAISIFPAKAIKLFVVNKVKPISVNHISFCS